MFTLYQSSLLKEAVLEDTEAVARRLTSGVTPKTLTPPTVSQASTRTRFSLSVHPQPITSLLPSVSVRVRRLRATRAANGRPGAPRAPTNQRAVAMWEAESIRGWAV